MAEAASDPLVERERVPEDVLRLGVRGLVVENQARIEVEHQPVGDRATLVPRAVREDSQMQPSGCLEVLVDDHPAALLGLLVPREVARKKRQP